MGWEDQWESRVQGAESSGHHWQGMERGGPQERCSTPATQSPLKRPDPIMAPSHCSVWREHHPSAPRVLHSGILHIECTGLHKVTMDKSMDMCVSPPTHLCPQHSDTAPTVSRAFLCQPAFCLCWRHSRRRSRDAGIGPTAEVDYTVTW